MSIPAIHPEEHLAEVLKEVRVNAAWLERRIEVPANRIGEIINGRRAITGYATLRLAHFLDTSADLWRNLQKLYELRVAEEKSGEAIRVLPTLKNLKAVRS